MDNYEQKYRERLIKQKQKNVDDDEFENEYNVFKNLLEECEIEEKNNSIFCQYCYSEESFIRTEEFWICGECGFCYSNIMEATDQDMLERDVVKKQFYKHMDYFIRKIRQKEGKQRATLPFSIERVKKEVKEGSVNGIIIWLRKNGLLKRHRRNIYMIAKQAFKLKFDIPWELKRDLAILYGRFLEFYFKYKVNKKKILPFNYLMREFIVIISHVRSKPEYLYHLFKFRRQKHSRNNQKNIQVFNLFKEDLKKSYIQAIQFTQYNE